MISEAVNYDFRRFLAPDLRRGKAQSLDWSEFVAARDCPAFCAHKYRNSD